MRDNCIQVAQELPVIYYYIIIPTNYNYFYRFIFYLFVVSWACSKKYNLLVYFLKYLFFFHKKYLLDINFYYIIKGIFLFYTKFMTVYSNITTLYKGRGEP